VAASIGIATGASTTEELLRNADVAMYAAKRSGGGWRRFEPAMLHRYRLRAALVRSVTRDEIEVGYQPVVDLGSGRIVAVRALPRWQRPSDDGPAAPSGGDGAMTGGDGALSGARPQIGGIRSSFAPWEDSGAKPLVRFEGVTKRFAETTAVKARCMSGSGGQGSRRAARFRHAGSGSRSSRTPASSGLWSISAAPLSQAAFSPRAGSGTSTPPSSKSTWNNRTRSRT